MVYKYTKHTEMSNEQTFSYKVWQKHTYTRSRHVQTHTHTHTHTHRGHSRQTDRQTGRGEREVGRERERNKDRQAADNHYYECCLLNYHLLNGSNKNLTRKSQNSSPFTFHNLLSPRN